MLAFLLGMVVTVVSVGLMWEGLRYVCKRAGLGDPNDTDPFNKENWKRWGW